MFQAFDYHDENKNLIKYGQPKPPIFDLSKINKVPVSFFVGKKDPLANEIDTKWAWGEIQSKV